MSSVSDWATSAREERRRYPENLGDMNEDLQAIDAIEKFLTAGQSTLRAARCIANIYESRLKTQQRYDVAILWVTICQAARSIDSAAAKKLAGLLITLRDQPDIVCSNDYAAKYGTWAHWRDLPKFGQMFREYGFEIDPPDGNDAEWHAQAPQLLNITIFAAHLMLHANNKPNVSFPASIAMDDGIDKPYDDTRELQEEWRMYVPPAATWILIAGSKIRELCFMDELPEDCNQHSVRVKWSGRTLCQGRWRFRKQRFWQLAEDAVIDIRCREYAKQAYDAMDKLDNEA